MSSAVTDRPVERRLVPVYTPASLQDRVVSRVVDFAVVFVITALGIFAVLRPLLSASSNGTLSGAGFTAWLGPILYLFGVVLFFGWSAWWASTEGKSPGRAAVGLSLIDEQTNEYLSIGRVVKRQLVVLVEVLTGGIITVLSFVKLMQSGTQSQALHDQLIGSRVARVEAREAVFEQAPEEHFQGAPVAEDPSAVAKSSFVSGKESSVAPAAQPTFTETLSGVSAGTGTVPPAGQPTEMVVSAGQNFAEATEATQGTQGTQGATRPMNYLGSDPSDTTMQQMGATQPMVAPQAVSFDAPIDPYEEATSSSTEPFAPPSNAVDQVVPNMSGGVAEDPLSAAPQRVTEAHQVVPPASTTEPVQAALGVPQAVATPWSLVGETDRFTFTQVAVLGREPIAAGPDQVGAQLVPVADPGLSVSKSHAMVGRDTDGIWIRDLGSRNGTFVAPQGGSWLQAMPGDIVEINPGDLVRLGHQQFTVA